MKDPDRKEGTEVTSPPDSAWDREAVPTSDQIFRAVFDQAFQFMGFLTPEGIIIEANQTALKLIQAEASMVRGKPFWESPWWTHSQEQQRRLRSAIKRAGRGEFVRFETTHPAPDGEIHIIDFSLKPVKDNDGKVVLLIPEGRDITEQKQAEAALRKSEAQVRQLLNSTAEGIYGLDLEGKCTFCNPATLRFLGYRDESNLLGKNIHTLIHHTQPDGTLYPEEECRACRAFRSGEGFHVHDEVFWRADGTSFPVEYRSHPVREGDRTIGAVVTFLDITERKLAEQDLRESEKRYHTLAEVSPVGIFHTDVAGKFLYVNERWCEITGFSRQEAMEKGLSWGLHPEDRERVLTQWCEAAGEGTSFRSEYRLQHTDGASTWVYGQIVGERDETDAVVGYVGTITDISQRKQVEEALEERNEFIETVMVNLPIGLTVIDLNNFDIKYINPRIEAIVGWPRRKLTDFDALLESTLPDLKFRKQTKEEIYADLQSGDVGRMIWEFPITKGSGEQADIIVRGIPLRERGLVIITVQDITERKRAEYEIRTLNQELEAWVAERTRELELANRELEAFSYSVSHDLRAPLRAIDGFSAALLEDYGERIDEEGKSYLRYLQDGSRDMSALIDGLLKLSRSTRGEMNRVSVDLSRLAAGITEDLCRCEPERHVSITITEGIEAEADPRLIKVVLENLLGNAWKYTAQTPESRIEFGAEQQDGKPVYFVRDNGAGFDMAYADKLFLPFQRLHKFEEFSGIGIGLATVQRIIHRHGGQIWARAAVGEGATFYFTLGDEGGKHG